MKKQLVAFWRLKKMKNKSGQVTLFVILAIVLVVAIILFFSLKPVILAPSLTEDPEGYIEKCISDSVKNSEDSLIKNNLNLNQDFDNFVLFRSEKVPYFCTVSEFYLPCTPQRSALLSENQKIIETRALRDVADCFKNLKENYQNKGYSVSEGNLILNISLLENEIQVEVKKNFVATKGENSFSFPELGFNVNSILYKLIKTAQTIVNYESTICEFNEINWMRAMPDPAITRFSISDQTKVYSLADRQTEKQIKFAIKTCVLPAGL